MGRLGPARCARVLCLVLKELMHGNSQAASEGLEVMRASGHSAWNGDQPPLDAVVPCQATP